jgi:hypothetical protein
LSITKARKAKNDKYFAKLISDSKHGILRRDEWLKRLMQDGGRLEVEEVPDDAKRRKCAKMLMIMNRQWLPLGNENHPQTIRFRQIERDTFEAVKNEYRIVRAGENGVFNVLTKTEFEYASGL